MNKRHLNSDYEKDVHFFLTTWSLRYTKSTLRTPRR